MLANCHCNHIKAFQHQGGFCPIRQVVQFYGYAWQRLILAIQANLLLYDHDINLPGQKGQEITISNQFCPPLFSQMLQKLTESCIICILKINSWDKRNECAVFPINNDFNFVIWYTLNDYACIKTIVKTGVWMYPCVHRKISTSVDPKSLLYWRRYVT